MAYHQRQGQPSRETSPDKASDLTTFLLAISPSQTFGAISSVTQVQISFAFEAQNFNLASLEAKTGYSIFSQALLKHTSSLVFVAQQHTKVLEHEL